jgi:hypothetical protein
LGAPPGVVGFGNFAIAKQVSKNWRDFFLSHNLVKHYVSTILQKEVNKKCCKKSLNMLEVERVKRTNPKKKTYIYLWKFTIFFFFFGSKWIFFQKTKKNHHQSGQTWKSIMVF